MDNEERYQLMLDELHKRVFDKRNQFILFTIVEDEDGNKQIGRSDTAFMHDVGFVALQYAILTYAIEGIINQITPSPRPGLINLAELLGAAQKNEEKDSDIPEEF